MVMRKTIGIAIVALAMALAAAPAQADLIYYTGTDANNDGIDDAFTVNGNPAYLVTKTANGWPVLPNPSITLGKYISWAADQSNATQGSQTGQLFTYAFSFNWAGLPLTTTFDFRWLSDDYLSDVLLNGTSLGVNNLGQPSPWTQSYAVNGVSGTVQSGINTIEFLIWNTGGQQPPYYGQSGPTGMAADFTVHGEATTVPEPASSMALLAMGLAGLACWRARQQSR
ncbi:MAG TPA: PEP-CTERM sorting domain-containing protein [Vicinamibacterales bacterium]|nr:PEP-CTERM sorting domain-containing protein [Vicinamibacterales bacterium]HOG29339.1 PEP-CTERM sorting domain-containing protein [Vicinamibacterales bacterium]HPW20746.1 PEP-CTERM sorting domain-containing protein [Vicinamibacterales bacterium]